MIPLNTAPLYAPNSLPNKYYRQSRNTTEWNIFMGELIHSGNALTKLMLQAMVPTLPGANIGQFATLNIWAELEKLVHENRLL